MKINGIEFTIKDKILQIKPPGIQLSLQYVKDALGIDDSFIFKSMFFGIKNDKLNKKETNDSVTYEYVISKKDMAKITFYIDMNATAWVDGEVVFKDTFDANDIIDYIKALWEDYEKAHVITEHTFINFDNFYDVVETKLAFFKNAFDMTRETLPDGNTKRLIYSSKKLGDTKLYIDFTWTTVKKYLLLTGVEVVNEDIGVNQIFFGGIEALLGNVMDRIQAVLKTQSEIAESNPAPEYINYKNRSLFTLKDIQAAGFTRAVDFINTDSIIISIKEANGDIGEISGFTKFSPKLNITLLDKDGDVKGNTSYSHPPKNEGYYLKDLLIAYTSLVGGEGSYTIKELKTVTKTKEDEITSTYLHNLCVKYSGDGVNLTCVDRHFNGVRFLWNITSNIVDYPLVIKRENIVDTKTVIKFHINNVGVVKDNVEDSIKAYADYCRGVELIEYPINQMKIKPGSTVKLNIDNKSISMISTTAFRVAEDAGIVKIQPSNVSPGFIASQTVFGVSKIGAIDITTDEHMVIGENTHIIAPKYVAGDLVLVDLKNIRVPFKNPGYNIEGAFKTSKGVCRITGVIHAWHGVAYTINFPNSYTKGSEFKTVYQSSIIKKLVGIGEISEIVPEFDKDDKPQVVAEKLQTVFGNTVTSLVGNWGKEGRAADVGKALADTQIMINKKFKNISTHVSKNGVYTNVQITNTKSVPGMSDALACVGGVVYGTNTPTTMCFPTKTLQTLPANGGVKTGQYTIKALVSNTTESGPFDDESAIPIKTISDVYVHEYGHIIHTSINNAKIRNLIEHEYDAYKKKFNVTYIPKKLYMLKVSGDFISQYSFANHKEFFAEAFTVYTLGTNKQKEVIPVGLLKLLDFIVQAKEI